MNAAATRRHPPAEGQCPSVHNFTEERCIRRRGHVGCCWGRFDTRALAPTIVRTQWVSRDGIFRHHDRYAVRIPINRRSCSKNDSKSDSQADGGMTGPV